MTISERFVLWTSWLINAYMVLIPFTEKIFCSMMLKNIQRLSKNRPNIPGVILSQKPAMFKSFFFTSFTISQNNVQAFKNYQSVPNWNFQLVLTISYPDIDNWTLQEQKYKKQRLLFINMRRVNHLGIGLKIIQ